MPWLEEDQDSMQNSSKKYLKDHSTRTTPEERNAKLVFRIRLQGIDCPSRNVMNSIHWSEKGRIRQAWSIYLARSFAGLQGILERGPKFTTMTIKQAAVKNCGIQSLPRCRSKEIVKKMGLSLNTAR